MRYAGGNNDHVAFLKVCDHTTRPASLKIYISLENTQHLMRCAMIMMIIINPVPPGIFPAVCQKNSFQGCCCIIACFLIQLYRMFKYQNRKFRVVWEASIFLYKLPD